MYDMQRVGLIDDIASAISDVGKLFTSIKTALAGDQVPEYPIKSKNTLQKILTDIQNAYPPPTSVAMAQEQLARAQAQSTEAYAKGGDVNTTYGMIFDKLVQTLKNYISFNGVIPNSTANNPNLPGNTPGNLCPDGKNYVDANGMCPSGPSKTMGFGMIALLIVGGIALTRAFKPKR